MAMKLYVWADPYRIPYGSAMVFAAAESLDDAKREARVGDAYTYGQYPAGTPNVELGDPTRVVDLPCAEWHRWEE